MSEQQPSEEELRAALDEQMRNIHVEDVILQTVVTLINLGARRLGLTGAPDQAGERDPEQARLAIEGARALVGLVESDQLGPIKDALSQLQMAYAQRAQSAGGGPGGPAAGAGEPAAGGPQPAEEKGAAEDAERAKARSKIWTPGES